MRRTIFAALIAALGWAALPGLGSAQPKGGPPKGKAAPKADKPEMTPADLRKALDGPLTLKIDPTNLGDAVEKLVNATKLPIKLDQTMIQLIANNGNGGGESQVALDAKGLKLKTALHRLFGPAGLTFAVIENEIYVSDEETVVFKQFKQRVSYDLDGVALKAFVKQVRAEHGVNILIDPRVAKAKLDEAPVTMSVEDVPLETALRLAGEMAGAKSVRVGNVILVTTEERADKLKDNEPLVQPPAGLGPGGALMLNGGGIQVQNGAVPLPVAPAEEPKEVTEEPKKEDPPTPPKEAPKE